MKNKLLLFILLGITTIWCNAQTQIDLPVTFDDVTVDYTVIDFGNNSTVLGVDPMNASDSVAITTKPVNAPVWAGTTIGNPSFANAIPFASGSTVMTVMVYSPDAGTPIRLKVENSGNPGISVETEDTTTMANAWEMLTFDFSNEVSGTAAINFANTYDVASIFFNFGTDGATAGAKTYYWDDVEFVPGVGNPLNQIDLPVTFDDVTVDYTVIDFGNNSTVLGVDPMNASDSVAITTKPVNAPVWAGTTIGNPSFANAIPFVSGSTVMTVMVYSPDAGTPIRLKVENSGNPGISVETEDTTTMANAWEMLTFDFSNEVSGTAAINFANTYDVASIFFNFGTDGATAGAKTYYWDDVEFVPGVGNPLNQIDLPVTFDDVTVDYTVIDFGNNSTVLGVDPMNASDSVAITTKPVNAPVWAGTTIGNPSFANAIPFVSGSTVMTVMVYSPDAGTPIRLKVENSGNPGISVETEDTTTMANAWEMLTFDFSNEVSGTAAINFANTYDVASIFFNFGTDGATAGAKTYYWDDVEFVPGVGNPLNQIDLPVTFDDVTVDYTVIDFGNNSTVLGVDPMNASDSVAITTKPVNAPVWAGTTIGNPSFANAIPFVSGSTVMTVMVYSPDAGTPIRLKVENSGNPGISVETEDTTTMANAWEMLTFDFSNEVSGTAAINFANTYDVASIFFNFGTDGATAGAKTYYWDDVEFVPGVGNPLNQIDLPVTFDDVTVDYTVIDFGNNSTVLGVDPMNASDSVAITTKPVNAPVWAGTTIGNPSFANAIPFVSGSTVMTVMVYSPDAGTPIRLKVENSGNPGISVETEDTTTMANAWEMLTFDFSNEVSGTAAINFANTYDVASIFFNFGTDGATAGAKTYYWDDVEFVPGVGNPLNQIDLPVTFDDVTVDYTVIDFGNNSTVLGVDPMNASDSVAITTKPVNAPVWAGTTIGNPSFANAIPFASGSTVMTVMVYSPDAGTPIRLKVENSGNPGISVETEDTTTMANAWEMLTFDFSNEVSGTAAINFANTYDVASIFFNFGTDGATAGAKTYYWDDVEFVPGVGNPLNQIDLPVTFDDVTVDYTVIDFGNNSTVLGVDPMNASDSVAITTKPVNAPVWAGTTIGNPSFANAIPFASGSTVMTVMVYSPDAGTPIRLKVENSGNPGISVETEDTTTMANAWEMLTFDFSNEVSGTAAINFANTYDVASIFFNFGTDGATAGAKTYYWDDVEFVPGVGNPLNQIDLPVTFDDVTVDYTVIDFGNNSTVLGVDPMNASDSVAITTKPVNAPVWAGTTIGNPSFANAIPFASGSTVMTVMVYSPDAGTPIRLKVENSGNPGISVETEDTTTMANAWEMLTFDFSNEVSGTAAINFANTYDVASIFFNFGTDGATAGAKTYYWDDVEFVPGVGNPLNQIDLPVTFDDVTVDYTVIDFGNNSTVLGVDPMNASDSVAITTKPVNAPVWAGTTIGNPSFANAIPFASGSTVMTVMVYSPDAGTPIRLKVENSGNPGISVETEDTTTMANAWEMLTFDFSNEVSGTAAINFANTYDVASIFFNFGTDGATAGAKTYYWDDVEFAGSAPLNPVDLPITFDDPTVAYGLTDFGGNMSAIVADPTNPSNTVAQSEKTISAQTWAGTTATPNNSALASPIPFSVGNTIMTVMVWSPDAGTPILLKVEDAANGSISVETFDTTTLASTWEMLTFDFTNEATGTPAIDFANTYDKVSIFFNFGTDGATAGSKTYYWDDVEFVTGGGNPLSQIDLPVTFDDSTVNYTMTDFGGNLSAVVVDPTNSSNMVGEATKTATAQLWAGTTMGDTSGTGFANAVPFSAGNTIMTAMVWSPDAGTPIRLKVEDMNDATISVETEDTTSLAGAWEMLTFDFSNEAPGTAAIDFVNTYDKASIFFNFGTDGATAGAKTYYWDDVIFVTSTGLEQSMFNNFKYYPNPAQEDVYFETDRDIDEILVFDLLGNQIEGLNFNKATGSLKVSELRSGAYIVKVRIDNSVENFRLIKE